MINQNLSQPSQKESTISRQTRYAFLTAVVFAVAAFANFFLSLRVSLETRTLVSYIDAITVLSFAVTSISSAVLIRAGQKERGTWRLIIALVVVLGIRNFVNEGFGYIFGVLAVVLVPFVALLTLKTIYFNRALAIGIFAGSAYVIFDIFLNRYLPPYRQSGEVIEPIFRMVMIMAGLLTVSYLYLLLRQSRFLQLSSKLTLAMTLVVLIPLVLLGVVSTLSLRRSLELRQQAVMSSSSAYLVNNINTFIKTTKNALVAETQSSAIREYLLTTEQADSDTGIRERALETLLFYQYRDILNIESYAILNLSGENILDTATDNIGNDESEELYFSEPLATDSVYVSDIQRSSTPGQYLLFFSVPITSAAGTEIGVLRAQYNMKVLGQFFEDYVTATSDADVFASLLYEIPVTPIDENDSNVVYLILANSADSAWNFKAANRLTTNIITPLQTGGVLPPGSTAQLSLNLYGLEDGLKNRNTEPTFEAQAFPREEDVDAPLDFIAIAPITEKSEWLVLTSQDLISINEPLQQQREATTLVTVLIAIGAAILAYFGSNYLIAPVLSLTAVAEKVSEGDFTTRAEVNTEDEIGTLGNAFNTMTTQLNSLVSTLEDRVSRRTEDLERRTQQLRAAVEVGKVAVSLRNLSNLLTQATELISLRFGFYHAGIFLLDEKGEYAVLQAANSEGGKRMLERNHKLKVGEVGIVGYVTQTGQARIALDVGQDAIYFDNPDLPQTRSEMALALIAGGQILGALDIQSTQGEAFSDADVTTLQVLADQIAISIENARLFEQNRNALQALRRAYGEQSYIGWQELMHTRKHYGYQGKGDGSIVPIVEPIDSDFVQMAGKKEVFLDDSHSIANIPIMVRGNPIGMLRLSKPETSHSWTENELELARTLSTELSSALDSARLFDEAHKQAEQEYVVGEITNKMRESMNVESVIKMAADEIYKLLDLDQIAIQFTPENGNNEKEDVA